MIDKLTNCPFCGQGVMIKANEEWNDDQILKEAIMRCTCDEARRHQAIQTDINEAEMYIKNDFPAPDVIKELFISCCEAVGFGQISKVSVACEKSKYTISKKAKGGMKIEKVTTVKETKEN